MTAFTQLALIWAGTLVAVFAARATRMTPVVYYLGVGALFVNVGWLPAEPDPFIRGLAEFGIVLIMFALGFEEQARNFLRSIRLSWGIALFGAVAPFAIAYAVAHYAWGDPDVSLICGLAMTATAVSLTMVSLRSEGLHQSRVATRIMTSAVLDDVASLALVAIVVPIVTGGGSVDVLDVLLIVAKSAAYFLLVVLFGVLVFPHRTTELAEGERPRLVDRISLRALLAYGGGTNALLIVLLLALVSALIGHWLGFHPAVGAYMAGLVMPRESFPEAPEPGSFEDTHRVVDSVAFSWIGPVFFVNLGARLDFDLDLLLSVVPQVFALTLGVLVFQVASATLAARFTGGMRPAASLMVGLGMLGRAELAFVVMDIAYVQHAILPTEAFMTLMVTCFFLNISVPLGIHWWKPYYDREEESRRVVL